MSNVERSNLTVRRSAIAAGKKTPGRIELRFAKQRDFPLLLGIG
jgi:hypothetical protein